MLTVYLANNIQKRAEVQFTAIDLLQRQVAVNSRWIWGDETKATSTEEDKLRHAKEDMEDVEAAEVLVYFADTDKIGLGKHIELGIALALRKTVFIVGKPSRDSVFFRLVPESNWVDNVEELMREFGDQGLV